MSKNKKTKKSINSILALFLSILSGGMVFVSIPALNLWPFAWIGLVPLLIAIRERSFWGAFFYGMATGYTVNALAFRCIPELLQSFGHLSFGVAIVLMVVLNIYQGLTFAFSAAVTSKIRKKAPALPLVIVFPVVFTGFEYLLPFIFPWYISNGQLGFKPFVQSFDLFGVSGGSFVIATFNATIVSIYEAKKTGKKFPSFQTSYGVGLLVLSIFYGVIRQHQIEKIVTNSQNVKIGVVEPDVGVWEKEVEGKDGTILPLAKQKLISHSSMLRLQFLSHKLEKQDSPDLILWPESGY